MSKAVSVLSATALQSILDQLSLAIFVFRDERLIYKNASASRLVQRLRSKYGIEMVVMLLDHLAQSRDRSQQVQARDRSQQVQSRDRSQQVGAAIALTGQDNEPFVVHLMEVRGRHDDIAVSVREIGSDISRFKDQYHLSSRETQVAELVLRGYRNSHIASTLGITSATTKKHLSRIFDKVGVDSRALLVGKLA